MKNASKEVDTLNLSLKNVTSCISGNFNLVYMQVKISNSYKSLSLCIRNFIVLSNKCVGMDYWLEWGNTELGKSVVRTFRFMHLISLNPLDREIKT